jgi:hypothetical protein
MKTSNCILMVGIGSFSLLLVACVESPTTPNVTAQALAAPPAPKTCQTDFATGSHYQLRTICMTEEEDNTARELEQQDLARNRQLKAQTDGKGWSPTSIVSGH